MNAGAIAADGQVTRGQDAGGAYRIRACSRNRGKSCAGACRATRGRTYESRRLHKERLDCSTSEQQKFRSVLQICMPLCLRRHSGADASRWSSDCTPERQERSGISCITPTPSLTLLVIARGKRSSSLNPNMLRLASKRVALPTRRVVAARLQSTRPPLPPPATTPLPPPETTPLPPPSGATATQLPPAPAPAPAEPVVVVKPPVTQAPELPKVELPKVELPKPAAPEIPSPAPAVHHAAAAGKGAASRLKSILMSSLLFLGTGALLVYAYDSRAGIHRCVQPLSLPAEVD